MRGSRGVWVPNYHGAWAMIIAPPLLGISLGGFTWRHLLLLVAWWVGFFAFFAAAKWLRARNRSRFTPALVTYGTVTALATLVLLSLTWPLTVWACAYLPLIAATAYLTVTGRERSLLNDIVTIVAAGMTAPSPPTSPTWRAMTSSGPTCGSRAPCSPPTSSGRRSM